MSFDAAFFERTLQTSNEAIAIASAHGSLRWCTEAFRAALALEEGAGADPDGAELRAALADLSGRTVAETTRLFREGGVLGLASPRGPRVLRISVVAPHRRQLRITEVGGSGSPPESEARTLTDPDTEQLYQHTPAAIFSLDRAGQIVAISDRALEVLGLTRDAVLGTPIARWLSSPWPEGDCDDAPVAFVVAGARVELLISQRRDPRYGTTAVVGRPAQRIRELEAELAEARRTAAELVEFAPIPVVVTDAAGALLLVNSAYERTFGVRRGDVLGTSVHGRFIVETEDLATIGQELRQHPERTITRRQHWRRSDGRVFPGLLTTVPLRDGEESVAYVSTVHDTTEVEAYDEELRTSVRLLDELAFIAGHDLRAPLRAMRQLSRFLRTAAEDAYGELPAIPGAHLDQIVGRVNRLEGLIDGLLRFARATDENAAEDPVDLAKLARRTWREQLSPADLESFALEIRGELPTLETASLTLGQVLANLFSNAVKHHDRPHGHVRLSAGPLRESRDQGAEREVSWVIEVEDDGPGVPPELHDEMFELFRTLRSRDEVESSGMGLAIVKRAVEARGGHVHVQSPVRDGRGLRVIVRWPERARAMTFKPTVLSRFHRLEELREPGRE